MHPQQLQRTDRLVISVRGRAAQMPAMQMWTNQRQTRTPEGVSEGTAIVLLITRLRFSIYTPLGRGWRLNVLPVFAQLCLLDRYTIVLHRYLAGMIQSF